MLCAVIAETEQVCSAFVTHMRAVLYDATSGPVDSRSWRQSIIIVAQ